MKDEKFFCDREGCGKQLDEGDGVTLQIIAAFKENEINRMIESIGEKAVLVKHLCNECYSKAFGLEPVVYDGESKDEAQ
jgi:hypothetical protein